jgi:hypothetical protein
VRYAPGHLSRAEIESVRFGFASLHEMLDRYSPDKLREGLNDVGGETIYFIPTPSAGLWATREKLFGRPTGFDHESMTDTK